MSSNLKPVPKNVTYSIAAKYDGECYYCKAKIKVGDLIFKLVDTDGYDYWCSDAWCGQKEKEPKD